MIYGWMDEPTFTHMDQRIRIHVCVDREYTEVWMYEQTDEWMDRWNETCIDTVREKII